MKLEEKKIAFCLTDVFYTFKNTIKEIENIIKEGGEVIPIMQLDSHDTRYGKISTFVEEIENICGKKIIKAMQEAQRVEADIVVIAPCSRKMYRKTSKTYL